MRLFANYFPLYGILARLNRNEKSAQNPHEQRISGTFRLAGAEGLEPSARGFGDRCSTN